VDIQDGMSAAQVRAPVGLKPVCLSIGSGRGKAAFDSLNAAVRFEPLSVCLQMSGADLLTNEALQAPCEDGDEGDRHKRN
jgi:hypothetical protein